MYIIFIVDLEVDQHDSVQNPTNVDVETDSSPAKTSLKHKALTSQLMIFHHWHH